MAALSEFRPLREESIDSIRARIDAGVNAGLDPADPRWRDTIPGGFFWDHTQTYALEAELLWDFASVELPASVFLPYSWGIYLDYWGELLSVPRKDAAAASGEVTFENTGSADVLIGTGARVAAAANDPEAEPLEFATVTSAVVAPSATVTLAVEATEAGTEYNLGAGAITEVLSPLPGVTVTNADATTGGADVEVDDDYKTRLLLEFSGSRGGGTHDDYLAELLAQPGVGSATVEPRHAGPGTVRLIVADTNGNPLSVAAVAALQTHFDSWAPVNHDVTVATIATLNVPVAATLELEEGFSTDGEDGTEDVTAAVELAVAEYEATLSPGEDVQINRVLAAILSVPGVYDVASLTLSGAATDRTVAALEKARLAVTLA